MALNGSRTLEQGNHLRSDHVQDKEDCDDDNDRDLMRRCDDSDGNNIGESSSFWNKFLGFHKRTNPGGKMNQSNFIDDSSKSSNSSKNLKSSNSSTSNIRTNGQSPGSDKCSKNKSQTGIIVPTRPAPSIPIQSGLGSAFDTYNCDSGQSGHGSTIPIAFQENNNHEIFTIRQHLFGGKSNVHDDGNGGTSAHGAMSKKDIFFGHRSKNVEPMYSSSKRF